jgi:hypothetical protein
VQTLKAKLKFGSAPNGAENGIGIQAGTVGCVLSCRFGEDPGLMGWNPFHSLPHSAF